MATIIMTAAGGGGEGRKVNRGGGWTIRGVGGEEANNNATTMTTAEVKEGGMVAVAVDRDYVGRTRSVIGLTISVVLVGLARAYLTSSHTKFQSVSANQP